MRGRAFESRCIAFEDDPNWETLQRIGGRAAGDRCKEKNLHRKKEGTGRPAVAQDMIKKAKRKGRQNKKKVTQIEASGIGMQCMHRAAATAAAVTWRRPALYTLATPKGPAWQTKRRGKTRNEHTGGTGTPWKAKRDAHQNQGCPDYSRRPTRNVCIQPPDVLFLRSLVFGRSRRRWKKEKKRGLGKLQFGRIFKGVVLVS